MARLEPVLSLSVNNSDLVRMSECTYYIRHVSVSLLIRKGRNFIVRSTQQEKLVLISAWKADKWAFAGCARLTGLLDSGIQEDTVQVRVSARDARADVC